MKDLFGNDLPPARFIKKGPLTERKSITAHKMLIALYGEAEGKKCKECPFFYYRAYSKRYPKCEKSGLDGHTQNHDWSSRWAACGLINKKVENEQ